MTLATIREILSLYDARYIALANVIAKIYASLDESRDSNNGKRILKAAVESLESRLPVDEQVGMSDEGREALLGT